MRFKLPRVPNWPLLVGPFLLFGLGFLMNAVVMAANGGQMPVLWPGGCSPKAFKGDIIHTCMTDATHLKFLADWIVINGLGVASPGDFLEWSFNAISMPAVYMWFALAVKESNDRWGKP